MFVRLTDHAGNHVWVAVAHILTVEQATDTSTRIRVGRATVFVTESADTVADHICGR